MWTNNTLDKKSGKLRKILTGKLICQGINPKQVKNTLFPSVNIYIFFNFQKLFQNAEKLYQRLHLRKEVCQVYFAIKNKKQDLQQAKTHSYSLAINRQIWI